MTHLPVLWLILACLFLAKESYSLDLGYEYDSETLIIENNEVHPDWVPTSPTMQVDEYESVSSFWIDLAENEIIETQKVRVLSSQISEPGLNRQPTITGDDEEEEPVKTSPLYRKQDSRAGEEVLAPVLIGDVAWESQSQQFEDEEQSLWLDLRLNYRCKQPGSGIVAVTLKVVQNSGSEEEGEAAEKYRELTFAWEKLCVEGIRLGMNVGTEEGETDVIEDGETQSQWKGDQVISRSASYSSFYLFMDDGFGSQTCDPPVVTSSNPGVIVHTRGYASLATEITDTEFPQELTVIYECLGLGSSLITVSLHIPPFDPLVWSWTKSCGGDVLSDLRVGLVPGGSEVIYKGQTQLSFYSYKSQKNEAKTDFYIQLDPSNDPVDGENNNEANKKRDKKGEWLALGTPFSGNKNQGRLEVLETVLITSSVSGLLRPVLEIDNRPLRPVLLRQPVNPSKPNFPLQNLQDDKQNAPGVEMEVDEEGIVKLTVYYGCLKKHQELDVTLSLLIQNHKMVEFTWKKECSRLTPSVDSSYWTANQILSLLIFFWVAAAISSYILYKKHTANKPKLLI